MYTILFQAVIHQVALPSWNSVSRNSFSWVIWTRQKASGYLTHSFLLSITLTSFHWWERVTHGHLGMWRSVWMISEHRETQPPAQNLSVPLEAEKSSKEKPGNRWSLGKTTVFSVYSFRLWNPQNQEMWLGGPCATEFWFYFPVFFSTSYHLNANGIFVGFKNPNILDFSHYSSLLFLPTPLSYINCFSNPLLLPSSVFASYSKA